MNPEQFPVNTDRPERTANFGQHKASPLKSPNRGPAGGSPPPFQAPGNAESWSEYGGTNGHGGMYRGNPVEYPNVGQANGFVPNRGPRHPSQAFDPSTQFAPPKLPSASESAMGRLSEQIDRLHATVRTLRSRLDPILTPVGPQCGADCAAGISPAYSELTQGIHSQASSLSNAIDIVDDLLARIEL